MYNSLNITTDRHTVFHSNPFGIEWLWRNILSKCFCICIFYFCLWRDGGVTDLYRGLETVLYIVAAWVICTEGEPWLAHVTHTDGLTEGQQELLDSGGTVKTDHL